MCRRSPRGSAMAMAYEDIRLAPSGLLTTALISSHVDTLGDINPRQLAIPPAPLPKPPPRATTTVTLDDPPTVFPDDPAPPVPLKLRMNVATASRTDTPFHPLTPRIQRNRYP
ncbi:unnamed protein product [Agarophyton chilense]